MCVIFIAFEYKSEYPLIVLANRDEFYSRPTAPAARWKDAAQIYAGRDLVAGGTWLGVTDEGRFAAVTNFREPSAAAGEISRGDLVAGFLRSNDDPVEYLEKIKSDAEKYAGFNLFVGRMSKTRRELFYFSNRENLIRDIRPGIYGLSNHLLDTPWPKVANGTRRFNELVDEDGTSTDKFFELLRDETLAAEELLPNTGVGPERERILSPIFIRTDNYGTRSSTVAIFDDEGNWKFDEKVFV